jgi:hypothetical protein
MHAAAAGHPQYFEILGQLRAALKINMAKTCYRF